MAPPGIRKKSHDWLSEHSAKPPVLIIHDPVEAGALGLMPDNRPHSDLEDIFLFREKPNINEYSRQHRVFSETLRSHAEAVIYLKHLVGDEASFSQAADNPNQVFTRDSVITFPWMPDFYIPARMKKQLRHPEVAAMQSALEKLGLRKLIELPEEMVLEGGDVIPFSAEGERALLIGYGPRTSIESIRFLADNLIPEHLDQIIGIELAGWRMNLDGGLVPVTEDVVLSDTQSIASSFIMDQNGRGKLDIFGLFNDLKITVIEVSREESVYSQACNCVCLGERKIIYYDLCPRVSEILREKGIAVIHVPGSELVKGRGGPRCMTRPVYAEPSFSQAGE